MKKIILIAAMVLGFEVDGSLGLWLVTTAVTINIR